MHTKFKWIFLPLSVLFMSIVSLLVINYIYDYHISIANNIYMTYICTFIYYIEVQTQNKTIPFLSLFLSSSLFYYLSPPLSLPLSSILPPTQINI